MATINYITRGNTNPQTIYLRFKQGNTFDMTKSTGYVISQENWSTTKKCVKVLNDAELKKIDKNLAELKNHISTAFNNTELHHINSDWLENEIKTCKGEVSSNKALSDVVTEYITHIMDTAHTRPNSKGGVGISRSRVNSYGNLLQMLKAYQGKTDNRVKDIDNTFARNFLNWMLTIKGSSNSYALKIISDLKTTCKDAGYNGIETHTQLGSIKAHSTKNENIIYLSTSELEQIENTPLTRAALINARRWLILGCHIGQRGNDLLSLNESNLNVRDGIEVIELRQAKGSKDVVIPLPHNAREIIAQGFPTKITTQTFNKHLKDICKFAKIDTPTIGRISQGKHKNRKLGTYPKHMLIGSHVCRRSFASNYYATLPTPLLMRITGHSTESMLLKYIGKSSIDYIQQISDYYNLKEAKEAAAKETPHLRVVKRN